MKIRAEYLRRIHHLAFRHNKMAFLTGPRQVGKTTLAWQFPSVAEKTLYYTWDDVEFRRRWIKEPKTLVSSSVGSKQWVIFDELHKAPRWKSTLKGIYDLKKDFASILVTGSARLDYFRKGGDSLLGRYFPFRIHPFTLGELDEEEPLHPNAIGTALSKPVKPFSHAYRRLLKFGGFPDPFLKEEVEFANAWRIGRRERLVREDLVDLWRVRELGLIETMMALLPARVGSPFSVQSLSEDLETNFPTIRRWLGFMEQLYYLYMVFPYSRNMARSLKKQPKLYLWDWSEISDPGACFENLVVSHFLKACHFWTDTGIGHFQLYYVRDKEKREVDVLVLRDGKPWCLAECKSGDLSPSSTLLHYAGVLKPAIVLQIVATTQVHERFDLGGGRHGYIVSADSFLALLP